MTYQGDEEFSNLYVWSFYHSAEKLGLGENRLGRTKIKFDQEKGTYTIHIEIPTEDIISECFKTNDGTLVKTIKYGTGGHEETHACIASGNLTRFFKLLVKYGVNEITDDHLTFAKEFDQRQGKLFDGRKEKRVLGFREDHEHALCYLGSVITLKRREIPQEYIHKFFEFNWR